MTRYATWIFAALAGPLVLALPAEAQAQSRRVVCESRDEQPTACDIGRHSGVEISRRFSDAGCDRDRDWWVEGNRVVVTDGCRAEFVVYSGQGGYNQGYNNRDDDDYYDRDRDDEYDQYGRDEDYDRYKRNNAYGAGGTGSRITCESIDNRPASCQIGRYTEVRMVRQYSSARCSKGRDWWTRGPELVVLNGCRAEFAIIR